MSNLATGLRVDSWSSLRAVRLYYLVYKVYPRTITPIACFPKHGGKRETIPAQQCHEATCTKTSDGPHTGPRKPIFQVDNRRFLIHNTLCHTLRDMSPFASRRSLPTLVTCLLLPAFAIASPLAASRFHPEGLSRRSDSAKIRCGNAPRVIAGL